MVENNIQPTYKRQRFLLAFIRQLRDGVTSTDLQKLVFLYTMKVKSRFYEFIPYKFGAYSFQLAEDADLLRRNGYLATEGLRIKATGLCAKLPAKSTMRNGRDRNAFRG